MLQKSLVLVTFRVLCRVCYKFPHTTYPSDLKTTLAGSPFWNRAYLLHGMMATSICSSEIQIVALSSCFSSLLSTFLLWWAFICYAERFPSVCVWLSVIFCSAERFSSVPSTFLLWLALKEKYSAEMQTTWQRRNVHSQWMTFIPVKGHIGDKIQATLHYHGNGSIHFTFSSAFLFSVRYL